MKKSRILIVVLVLLVSMSLVGAAMAMTRASETPPPDPAKNQTEATGDTNPEMKSESPSANFTFTSVPSVTITDDAYIGVGDGNDGFGPDAGMVCDVINTAAAIHPNHVIEDVTLGLWINHTWTGDLVVKLRSPSGTILAPLQRPLGNGGANPLGDDGSGCCGDSSNLISTSPIFFNDVYTDDAETMGDTIGGANYICQDDGRCSYAANPDQALVVGSSVANFSAFDGEHAAGPWTLCVGDGEVADVGALITWDLTLNTQLGDVGGSFTPPGGGGPVGLEHNGSGDLYMTEIISDSVYLIDTSGAEISSFSYLSTTLNGLGITTDGTNIYLTDTDDDDVDIYNQGGTYLSSFSVISQTTFPEGITYNPLTGNLYVVDGDVSPPDKVIEYTLSGSLVTSYTLPTNSTDGIAFDPQRCSYWIYDSGSDSIRHYDLNFTEIENFPGTAAAGYSNGEGVAVISDTVYVVATGSNLIVEFDVSGADSSNAGMCSRINVSPPSLSSTQLPNATNDQTLTINNVGITDLDWMFFEAFGNNPTIKSFNANPTANFSQETPQQEDNDYQSWQELEKNQPLAIETRATTRPGPGLISGGGGLSFIHNRAAFDAAFPALPVEDFEESPVPPFVASGCEEPLDSLTNDGVCFSAGDIITGIAIQTEEGIRLGCGSAECPMVVLGDNLISNHDHLVGPNFFADTTELNFPGTSTFAVGMDIYVNSSAVLSVTVYGPGDAMLGQTTVPATPNGAFLGVSSSQNITRIHIDQPFDTGDVVDNIAFGNESDCQAIPWASTDVITGTTAPGIASSVAVTFNSYGLSPGSYSGNLCINNSDPTNPLVKVPVSLTVEQAQYLPQILKQFIP